MSPSRKIASNDDCRADDGQDSMINYVCDDALSSC